MVSIVREGRLLTLVDLNVLSLNLEDGNVILGISGTLNASARKPWGSSNLFPSGKRETQKKNERCRRR